jgi:hypothetical protein
LITQISRAPEDRKNPCFELKKKKIWQQPVRKKERKKKKKKTGNDQYDEKKKFLWDNFLFYFEIFMSQDIQDSSF